MKAKRYNDAIDEFRALAAHTAPENRAAAMLDLADALHRAGREQEARSELTTLPSATPDQSAQRLYILGEIAWKSGDNEAFFHYVDQLRQASATSLWLEAALLSVGNLHLVHHERDQAIDAFANCSNAFPPDRKPATRIGKSPGSRCARDERTRQKSCWKSRSRFTPGGNEASNALYWRARLAEEDNQPAMARAFYQKLPIAIAITTMPCWDASV
jgi:hypothetical protein